MDSRFMTPTEIWSWLQAHRDGLTGLAITIGSIVMLIALVRAWRGRDTNAKKVLGFAVVQAGVTFIVVTGVYDFFRRVLAMPAIEAVVLAVFIEAATWGAVGFIYAHGKAKDENGQPRQGFGEAGPFFWFSVCGGGTLAVLGSSAGAVAVGRIVIVAFGAYMWYLQLLQVTTRSGQRSRWRWTPKRMLLAVGALEPADEDVTDEAREWQIRKLARAIRWTNSRWPWSWLGARALDKRAETTTEDVLAAAVRRRAAAHVIKANVRPDSPVMAALVHAVESGELASADGRAELTRDAGVHHPADTVAVPSSPERAGGSPHRRHTFASPAASRAIAHQRVATQPSNGAATRSATVGGGGVHAPVTGPADGDAKDLRLPKRPETCQRWLDMWMALVADGAVNWPFTSTEEEAQERYGVSRKQLKNVQEAAMAGQLRAQAEELGIPLPDGYVDDPAETTSAGRTPV